MNLLIVDDAYYSVEGIRSNLDWESLGIDHVFCAYNMEQAQNVFRQQKIDILITDIEMPKGSGLDLLSWARQQNYKTVCIFLTSFAKFDYASHALKLKSFDYLLKPVEKTQLLNSVKRAVEEVHRDDLETSTQLHADYWDSSRVRLAEQFWHDVACGIIPPVRSKIVHEIEQMHLLHSITELSYIPVMLQCRLEKSDPSWERNLYEYAVKNILNELLYSKDDLPVITRISDLSYLIILPETKERTHTLVLEQCRNAVHVFEQSLPGTFNFFVGDTCSIEQFGATNIALQQTAHNHITKENSVLDIEKPGNKKIPIMEPPIDKWNELILSQQTDALKRETEQYLTGLQRSHNADRRDLVKFYHDFLQIIYSVLEKSGACAHQLFQDNTSEQIAEQAFDSVDNMKTWVEHALTAYNECMSVIKQSSSTVETVKKHIRDHISEELTRNSIAAAVYLSPDYLSHVFREKTGISLTDYITNQRIKKAKELLLLNQMSVRDVALLSGFQNISYFSKQFRRLTGKTPQQFRKKQD